MKKKKILLIILPIILILIVAAVLIALYYATDMFKSSSTLFAKYFSQNGEIFDIMSNPNIEEQNNFKTNNTYTMTGDLTTKVQDGTNEQEIKATTAARHDANTGRTYSELTVKNGESDALKVSYIKSGDVYAIKCDDIMSNYIGIRNSDLKKFAQNMGASAEDIQRIPDNINLDGINEIANITEEQKQHIIGTYSKVIAESIPIEKYSKLEKKQISVDGVNYETNVYQVTIDETTLKQIIVNCLTTLKDDNTTLVLISNKFSSLGMPSEYTDITKLSETIGNLVTQLQNENTNNANIIVTVYENKGKTIRTEIAINTNQTEEIQSMTNTTPADTTTIGTTNQSATNVITIDKIDTENAIKAILTIEQNKMSNGIIPETTPTSTQTATISQIILQKTVSDVNTTNEITIIPNTNNAAQSIIITTSIGKIGNETITNSSNITLNISTDGINVQTMQASYVQNMQVVNEIEEIMELKNSNTIIVNNYTKEQLVPFLTRVGEKTSQVLQNKLSQLGIAITGNTNNTLSGSEIINDNNIMKIAGILGTSGISIANVNGLDIPKVTTVGGIGIGAVIYNQLERMSQITADIISQTEAQEEITNQMIQNLQEQLNTKLGQ